jgi:hypothetical protein
VTALGEHPAPLPDRIQEDRAERAAAAFPEQVRGRAVFTVIGAVFFAIGWVIGAAVSIVRFCAAAVRYGYAQGRLVMPSPPAPEPAPQPAPSRPQPAPV